MNAAASSSSAAKMKLLVGFDGSPCSADAIADLARAGLPATGEAIVLSIADLLVEQPFAPDVLERRIRTAPPPAIVEAMQRAAAHAMDEARSAADRGVELMRAVLPDWTVHAEAVADSPYWILIQRAESWPADLVLVGSHGRSAISRFFLGSVSQNVLSHSPCSVRIGRRHDGVAASDTEASSSPNRPLRIVFATDASEGSDRAAKVIGRRTWPCGSEIRVVTVLDPRWTIPFSNLGEEFCSESNDLCFRTIAQRQVDAVAAGLADQCGVKATGVVLVGSPRYSLIHEADNWNADCIFLGARGHGAIERFVIGSVSASVAAHAKCSVEVVRCKGV